jgi:branched-chain amino acid aminotransferase
VLQSGNYAPTFIHATAAKKAGYAITLHLDSLTHSNIDEFSTSNFLAISSPAASPLTTLVVPTSPSILKSITTESIIEIAQSKGWIVERRIVPFAEVINGGFSEVAACGTAAAITPIKSITYHTDPQQTLTKLSIGNGETPGAIFLEILNELTGVQCGDMKDTRGWVWPAEGISLID